MTHTIHFPQPGDEYEALCSHAQGGTTLAVVTAERVVALNDGVSWRVETTRPGSDTSAGDRLHFVVGITGHDRNGYVRRVATSTNKAGQVTV